MNSFLTLTKVITNYVIEEPKIFTEEEVKRCGRILSALATVSKKFNTLTTEKLQDLKKTHALIKKYHVYNEKYKSLKHVPVIIKNRAGKAFTIFYPGGNPQLVDALSTGSKRFASTFSQYTDEIGDDIKEIVRLMPPSIRCTMVKSYSTSYVGPLSICCFNRSIPIEIIEFLLKKGVPTDQIHLEDDRVLNTEQVLATRTMDTGSKEEVVIELFKIDALLQKYKKPEFTTK